jgi:hypothetical protein
VLDHSSSGPRSGCTTGKFNLPVRGRRAVEEIIFGVLLLDGRKRLSLGTRRGKKEILDRWPYLDSINIVLVIGI